MNVFYLNAPLPEPEPFDPPTRWSILRARAARRYWRLRIMLAEIAHAIRRPRRATLGEDFPGIVEAAAQVAERQPGLRGPARVIDFDEARRRLRPAASE